MESKLILALANRLLEVEGADFPLSLYMLHSINGVDYEALNMVYDNLYFGKEVNLHNDADIRAKEHGFHGITDMVQYGKNSTIFEG